jgi:hypothetical protein
MRSSAGICWLHEHNLSAKFGQAQVPAVQTSQYKIGRRLAQDAWRSGNRRRAQREPQHEAGGKECSTHALQRLK